MRNAAGIPQGKMKWTVAPRGGGGYCTTIGFADDGVIATQSDVYGCFVKDPSVDISWKTLFSANSLPNGEYPPTTSFTAYVDGSPAGGYGTALAPSNSQHVYGCYNGYWWHSSNRGTSWTKIGGPYTTYANTGDQRLWNNKCVVDPTNPLKAMLGTEEGKIVYVTDGATPNVLTVAAGSTTGGSPTPHLVAVNRAGTRWAYSVAGTGVYESTAGIAGPYSLLAGSPTNPCHLSYEADNNLWALQYFASETTVNNNIYKKTPAGSFTNLSNALNNIAFFSLAVNPQNTNQIVVISEDGILYQTLDGGTNWTEWAKFFNDVNTYPTAIGWMTASKPGGFPPAKIQFHPTNGRLYASSGSGVLWSVPPTTPGNPWNWFDDTLGIENLEDNHLIWPPGGDPIYASGDFGLFPIRNRTRWVNKNTLPAGVGDSTAWFIDWAPTDPTFLVACVAYFNGDGNCHGYSADGGTTLTRFTGGHPSGLVCLGGPIVAASKTDFYHFPSDNKDPAETHDGGVTWTLCSFPGVTQGLAESGWGFDHWSPNHIACSDKTNGDVYAWNYGPTGHTSQQGIYYRQFGTGSWVKQGTGPSEFASGTGQIECIPGRAGELLAHGNGGGHLYHSTNKGATWTQLSNISNMGPFCCGKAAPGQTFPAVYINAIVSAAGDIAGVGGQGIWRSDDGMVSWTYLITYPLGSLSSLGQMAASQDTYGMLAIGTGGNGGFLGTYDCPIALT